MRTAIILGTGFVLLGACLAAGWFSGGAPRMKMAALVFIGLWFIATAANMYVGIARAGYSFMEELPIFLLLFAVPAIVALVLRYKL
ncbi:MAG TPA: hypothetical protein VK624_15360 [Steroidobacteraceae bacterium]|nr:hypothetical protein [Steroidobacteraceae bacterium]